MLRMSRWFAVKVDNDMTFSEVLFQQFGSRSSVLIAVEAGLFALLNVVALLGNVLVCCAVYRHRSHHTITNLYIAALAISDLIFAVFVMPFTTGTFVVGRWVTGREHCLFQGVCFLTFVTISLQTMSLIAVNRCVRRETREVQEVLHSQKNAGIYWDSVAFVLHRFNPPSILGQRRLFLPSWEGTLSLPI